ncbi:MFS transporter [Carboxylicivirga taeanensis]|uniref:MFS transporter n=1 Tax=Carboxylicivirga taeanensis TaxID=1416875 RepID=UPI003F6E1E63
MKFQKDKQYYKFSFYGFFKNLKLFDPFLLLFFLDKGLTYAEIGILYAFREVVINLLEVVSGVIADVAGRKNAMLAGFVSYIISFLLFYVFSGFAGFLLAFFFYGIGDSFRTGTHKAMINAYLLKKGWHQEKVLYYGRTRGWSQRGAAISSLLSAGLLFYTGEYDLLFLLTVIPFFFDLLLMSTYPSYLNGERSFNYALLWPEVKAHAQKVFGVFKKMAALHSILLTSSYTGYYKAIKDYVQIVIAGLALKFMLLPQLTHEQTVAIYIGLGYFGIYYLNSLASRNAHRIERKFASLKNGLMSLQRLGYGFGLMAAIFLLLDYQVIALLAFVLIFVVQNLRRPLAMDYISRRFDEKMMASVMSVESQSETIFSALFALVLGILVDLLGLGWGIGSLSVLLMVLSAGVSTRQQKK